MLASQVVSSGNQLDVPLLPGQIQLELQRSVGFQRLLCVADYRMLLIQRFVSAIRGIAGLDDQLDSGGRRRTGQRAKLERHNSGALTQTINGKRSSAPVTARFFSDAQIC